MLGVRAAKAFGTAALVVGLTALASAFACSLIVGDTIAIIHCDPDGGSLVCGNGQICAPSLTGPEHTCTKPCSSSSPCSMGMCDPDKGWCVLVNPGDSTPPIADAGTPDVGLAEAPIEDVVPMMEAEASASDSMPRCAGFGCRCMRIDDCDSKFVCVDKMAMPDLDAGGPGSYCAKPCCTSFDCDMGDGGGSATVCLATGAGGNYCVPTSMLGDRSGIGSLGGGASCGSGSGSACRSGLCLDSGLCADTCCTTRANAAECLSPTGCSVSAFPGGGFDMHWTANCSVPPLFPRMTGMSCTAHTDCQSGLCVDSGLTFIMSTCQDLCRTASDCTMFGTSCQYLPYDPTTTTDIVAGCGPRPRGNDGGPSVCFVDDYNSSSSDCPSGEHCRPEPGTMVGALSYSVLACGM
jgi:hypothetical protein